MSQAGLPSLLQSLLLSGSYVHYTVSHLPQQHEGPGVAPGQALVVTVLSRLQTETGGLVKMDGLPRIPVPRPLGIECPLWTPGVVSSLLQMGLFCWFLSVRPDV